MLEGLPYVAILLLLLLLLLVLFLILLFIFLFCTSRLSTRQSKVDGTLAKLADHPRKRLDNPARLDSQGDQALLPRVVHELRGRAGHAGAVEATVFEPCLTLA